MFEVSYRGEGRKILWQELWRHEFEQALSRSPIVIIPTGSIEQHGPHCPSDVDISIPFSIAVMAAQQVEQFPVLVAPPVWWGVAHYNKGFPGTISLRPGTYQHLLEDVCVSLWENGFQRIVLLNGHGGNAAPNRLVRDTLSEQGIFVIAYDWWASVADVIEDESDSDLDVGHGGEWETSAQLFLREQLISTQHISADVPLTAPFDAETSVFATFAERRRDTRDGTGIMGDARVATKGKGKAIVGIAVHRLISLVQQFHKLPIREYREFGSHCP